MSEQLLADTIHYFHLQGGENAPPAASSGRAAEKWRTVMGLRQQLALAIDDFLHDCAEQGIAPEKPASGKILLRVPPEVHGAALVAAQAAGKSLNQWATELLTKATHST